MNTPDLLTPWLAPLGWLALEAAIVVLAALTLQSLLRTAAARRSLWRAALLALVAVLAAELTGTGSQLPAQLRLAWQTTFPAPILPPAPPPAPEQLTFIPPPGFSLAPIGGEGAVPTSEPLQFEPVPSLPPAPLSLSHSPTLPPAPSPLPAFLWLAGLAALLTRTAWTHAGFAWLRFRHFLPAAEALRERVHTLAARLGLRRRVRVLTSERLRAPVAFGWVRPGVGVPGDFTARFAPAQQDVMLAHELAHLAARDPLWQLLADLVTAALWWHPLAWVARRQHRLAGELAADDASLALPDGPVVLAECLLTLGHEAADCPRAALGMAGFRSQLGRRVERLLALPRRDWQAPSRARLALQTTVALLALAAIALLPGCAANRTVGEAPAGIVAKWWQAKTAPVAADVRRLQSNAESSQSLVTSAATNALDISVGRQLFVDDFLIASNTLKRTWHQPVLFSTAPLLAVRNQLPPVNQFFESVWFEPTNQHFKLGLAHGVRFFRDFHSPSGTNWLALNSQSRSGPLVEQSHQRVTTDYENLHVSLSRAAEGIGFGFARSGAESLLRPGQPIIPLPTPTDGSRWTDMHPLRNGFLVVGRNLHFYFGGQVTNHGPPVSVPGFPKQQAAVGLATLRRDGFASLDAGPEGGVMTTKPVTFTGRFLFLNWKTNTPDGELRVEMLDTNAGQADGTPLRRGYSMPNDQTLINVIWHDSPGTNDLSAFTNRPVRFRFHLKNASLYSFWVGPGRLGRSLGRVAGGGPHFTNDVDTIGNHSYSPLPVKLGALAVGDYLRVEVTYVQGTTGRTLRFAGLVAPAGYIPLPRVTKAVVVAGKTIEEARESIREGYLASGFEAVEVKLTKADPPPPAPKLPEPRGALPAPVGDDVRSLTPARNAEGKARNEESSQRLVTSSPTVVQLAAASPKGVTLPVPNPYHRTNSEVPFLAHSSKGAQRINRKLEEIVLPEVHFDGVPLVGVVQRLIEDAKKFDPDPDPKKKGLNFLINDVAPAAPLLDAAGNPVPVARPVALSEGLVRVSQPLKNLTLRQALDVICKNAELPTQFSVEEYAIAFIPRGPVAYYSRMFRVNPDTFMQGLQGVGGNPVLGVTPGGGNQPGAAGQNQPAATTPAAPVRATVPATVPATQTRATDANALVRQFFQSAGVTALGATNGSTRVFFNPENGLLIARGTTNDLRVIEQAIQKVQPQAVPPPTNAAPTVPTNALPKPNVYLRTNSEIPFLTHSSKGAQKINRKLDGIILPEVRFDSVPLPQVLVWLDANAKQHDPEKKGLNFLINNVVIERSVANIPTAPLLGQPDNNPATKPTPEPFVLAGALVQLPVALTNLTLRQALDVICKTTVIKPVEGRGQALKYTVEEYAIVFSPKLPEQSSLFARMFKVDAETFLKGLRNVAFEGMQLKPGSRAALDQALLEKAWTNAPAGTNRFSVGGIRVANGVVGVGNTNVIAELNHLVRLYFTAAGVANLGATNGPDATQVFFNDRNGLLLVRASLSDLDIIQQAVELLNAKPVHVLIEAKLVFTGPEEGKALGFDGKLPAGELTNAFKAAPPAGHFPAPVVRVARGTNAAGPAFTGILTAPQMAVVLKALAQRTNSSVRDFPKFTTPSGRVAAKGLDAKADWPLSGNVEFSVLPGVEPDGQSIRLWVRLTRGALVVVETECVVWDAQTVMLGLPGHGSARAPQLLLLLTPTLIDPAGHRIHTTSDQMPFSPGTVPRTTPSGK